MTYNQILKILMVRYNMKNAAEIAATISYFIGAEIKKRKINAYTSSPDNRRYQKCPKEHLIAFVEGLKNDGIINEKDYVAVTTYPDNQLFEYFKNANDNGT